MRRTRSALMKNLPIAATAAAATTAYYQSKQRVSFSPCKHFFSSKTSVPMSSYIFPNNARKPHSPKLRNIRNAAAAASELHDHSKRPQTVNLRSFISEKNSLRCALCYRRAAAAFKLRLMKFFLRPSVHAGCMHARVLYFYFRV